MSYNAGTYFAEKSFVDISAIAGWDGISTWNVGDVDSAGRQATRNYIWNTSSLAWEAATGSLAGGGNVTVTNFPATQAISAASLPLPTGAATETTLATNTSALPATSNPPLTAQINVTTAGTRVQLPLAACKWFIVKAKSTNTGNIFAGGAGVTASNGYILTPGEAVAFDGTNTNLFYIDSSVNGEGVSIIARN